MLDKWTEHTTRLIDSTNKGREILKISVYDTFLMLEDFVKDFQSWNDDRHLLSRFS